MADTALGHQYTVTECGMRGTDGQVESLGVTWGFSAAVKAAVRMTVCGKDFVTRRVTGRDPVNVHRLSKLPMHVESTTEWVIDR